MNFASAIAEKTLQSTITLTAPRGRGKSAALGLGIASAVAHGYSNIFVTSPSPENVKTLFEFTLLGLKAAGYQEHTHFTSIESKQSDGQVVTTKLNIFRDHRQTVQYIDPCDYQKLSQAELVVVDEAAAIPLPVVKKLFGPYLIFLSSTVNGYEGTGRSLSLKLIGELRKQSVGAPVGAGGREDTAGGRHLQEIELEESIRYAPGDSVEEWLNDLLCLNVNAAGFSDGYTSGCPPAADCELYYVNRDALFSYHKVSEAFLHRVVSLMVSSHYKNSPNDMQILADAPAHHLFCLLKRVDREKNKIPEVLCVVQVSTIKDVF